MSSHARSPKTHKGTRTQPPKMRIDPLRGRLPRLRAIGKHDAPWEDFYHWILTIQWRYFFLFIAIIFVMINVVFAALYRIDPTSVSGTNGSFEDLFHFSVQTMATIGYGGMAPANRYGHTLVTIEALTGITTTALLTGLTFAKFARPTARVLFSEKLVVGKRNGQRNLSMRVANFRGNNIAEANLKLLLMRDVRTAEGETFRRPNELKLVRNTNPFFALTWTVMHEIDETSPFFGEDAVERLAEDRADLIAVLSGHDESLGQTIFARYRYTLEDIAWGARFVDVLSRTQDGNRVIDYRLFHDVQSEDAS